MAKGTTEPRKKLARDLIWIAERSHNHYSALYLDHGKVRHLVAAAYADVQTLEPLCNVGPLVSTWWLGTGDQKEYDKVASLPDCLSCRRVLEKAGYEFTEEIGVARN
jgi:hypothetical protein